MLDQYHALEEEEVYLNGTFNEASHHYLIIELGTLGFVTLETNERPLEKSQTHALISIMKILCEHITACIEKEALRRSHDKIYKQLYFDELTGLPNRKGLFKTIKAPHERILGAVLFNIKEFGLINHQYGYPAGDKILKRIASALEEAFGTSMTYHIGPDEFLTFHNKLGAQDGPNEAETTISKVKSVIRQKTLAEDNIFMDMWSSTCHNSKPQESR